MASPGGFIPLSPAPTTISTTSTSRLNTTSLSLPHPRSKALRAGSSKEDAVRRYVENGLLNISRKYTKKFQGREEEEGGGSDGDGKDIGNDVDAKGYESMREVCRDVDELLDVLWLSGTPNLQIPYLLNIAGAISTYMTAFPPSPTATFRVLRKLDHAFASLLVGRDVESGEGLPGFGMEFGGRSGMSKTDMVRCKSLVESTRVLVVEVMSRDFEEEEDRSIGDGEMVDTDIDMGTDTENDGGAWNGGEDDDDDDYGHNMDVARVYEKTLTQLGEVLKEAVVLSPDGE